jgi:hypothetical protein
VGHCQQQHWPCSAGSGIWNVDFHHGGSTSDGFGFVLFAELDCVSWYFHLHRNFVIVRTDWRSFGGALLDWCLDRAELSGRNGRDHDG